MRIIWRVQVDIRLLFCYSGNANSKNGAKMELVLPKMECLPGRRQKEDETDQPFF
jgi:hypothetical protein